MKPRFELVAVAMFSIAAWGTASSQSDSADLAQQLTNPIADLITVPIQMNIDRDITAENSAYVFACTLSTRRSGGKLPGPSYPPNRGVILGC